MIRPKHVGPVMCLTSSGDGLFVSGGQDGTLRNGILSKRQQQLTRRRRTTTMLEMVAVHKSRPSVITYCLGINYGLGVCGPMVSVLYWTVESNRLWYETFHSLHEMRLDIVQANLTLSMLTEYE